MHKQNRFLKKKQMLQSLQTANPLCLSENCRSHYPALPATEPEVAVPAEAAAVGLAARALAEEGKITNISQNAMFNRYAGCAFAPTALFFIDNALRF